MARSILTYVLLLFTTLVACPEAACGGQDRRDGPEPQAPLLPVEQAWSVTLFSPPAAPGALDESRVYVPLQSGQIVALGRETGAVEWTFAVETSWRPAVGNDAVYVAGPAMVHAMRAATGDPLWAIDLDAEPAAAPVRQGDSILLLVEPGELRALRAADGSEIWRRTVGTLSGSTAIAADATSVCVTVANRLIRLSLDDGRVQWERELSGVLTPPTIHGDRVFVGSTDNHFYAINGATGRLEWRWRSGGDVVGSAADERLVYVASLDNLLRALRRGSGNQVWKRDLSTRTIAPPTTFGGLVLVSGNDPTLATFNAATGEPIDKFALSADLEGVPLVDVTLAPFRVAMVAVTRDARAIGLRPAAMMFREPALVPLHTLPGKALNREPYTLPNPNAPPRSEASGSGR